MLGVLSLVASVAFAGNVYLNDVLVNPADLSSLTLKDVTVRFDPNGTVRIDAPRYVVEPVSSPSASAAPPSAVGAPPVARPPTSAAARPPAPAGMPVAAPPATASTGPRVPAPPSSAAVPAATWWMVTEDNGSFGHAIEVYVNDALVHRIESGEPQKILDIAPQLRRGANKVIVTSNSVRAGGGSFYVYLGHGSDQSGTVVMDKPEVQYGVGPTRDGPFSREYTLNVP